MLYPFSPWKNNLKGDGRTGGKRWTDEARMDEHDTKRHEDHERIFVKILQRNWKDAALLSIGDRLRLRFSDDKDAICERQKEIENRYAELHKRLEEL